jgi:cation diffusion facilitator CzcD-associated flavoprotein CzcO
MTHLAGRRKPKASDRSCTLLKANARALIEAEVLVRIFNDTIEQGQKSIVLAGRLQDRLASPRTKLRPISLRDISAVYSAYKALQQDWRTLPIGGTLTRQW